MIPEPKTIHTDPLVLEITVRGQLEKADYRFFGPAIESLIEKHGKLNLLLRLVDFKGWTAGALWEDIKFDFKHFNDFEKIAIVGEKTWEKGMAVFCKPFTTAKVRFFESDRVEEAERWVKAADTETAASG